MVWNLAHCYFCAGSRPGPAGRNPKLSKPQQKAAANKQKKKPKQTAKKSRKSKKKEASTSSSSASSSSESSSSSSSSETDAETSSSASTSSSSEGEKGSKKKKKGGKKLDLDLLEMLWPKEDRPKRLQKKSVIESKSMSTMLRMKDQYTKEMEKKGMGAAVYGRDQKPKPVKYKAMRDDGEKKLHPARFERMPRAEPKEYWDQVPTGRPEVYRHLRLQHLGVENVPEATIVKLHDRKVPVELSMMAREVNTMRQVQLAVCSYVTVMRILHPIDMGGVTVQWVLTEAGWAELLGDIEKDRVQLVKRFFDSCATENSGRAVRKEPPMDYDQVKARWYKEVAAAFPMAALATMGQQMLAMGANTGGKGGAKGQNAAKNAGGGTGGSSGGGGKPAAPTQKTQGNVTIIPSCNQLKNLHKLLHSDYLSIRWYFKDHGQWFLSIAEKKGGGVHGERWS